MLDALRITGTFLDEISHDIPHQNWGRSEWSRDFRIMASVGIDTVILARCGYRRFMTYPSDVLHAAEDAYLPPVDLVDMFLDLAERNGMAFYFGTYDSGRYWTEGRWRSEIDVNLRVMEETWARYGKRKAFRGWYLTQEVSRRTGDVIDLYAQLGARAKALSGGLPVMISPWIDGVKAVSAFGDEIGRPERISPEQHEREWGDILSGIADSVDVVAFQDGHVGLDELPEFLCINKVLAEKYGLGCWTNCESFDWDMPIKFLPIKWEKLLRKLYAARQAGVAKAVTFEFSHFMSPQSAYLQAGHLLNRYCEHFGIIDREAL